VKTADGEVTGSHGLLAQPFVQRQDDALNMVFPLQKWTVHEMSGDPRRPQPKQTQLV